MKTYAVLSVMSGIVNGHLDVWANLFQGGSGSGTSTIALFDKEAITEMIPFGHASTPTHRKLAILNHHISKGFKLGSATIYQSSNGIVVTEFYLEIPQTEKSH